MNQTHSANKFLLALPLASAIMLTSPTSLLAGMPFLLPHDVITELRLHESVPARLQAISFFGLGLALSALAVMLIWNYLRRDFPRLPYLSYWRAGLLVIAWGLLFVIVLTMISGARELMTPGAWQREGFTYSVEAPQEESP